MLAVWHITRVFRCALSPDIPVGDRFGVGGWADEQAMLKLLALFQVGDRVFFLSENTRGEIGGIRRLLQERVQPLLAEFKPRPVRIACNLEECAYFDGGVYQRGWKSASRANTRFLLR